MQIFKPRSTPGYCYLYNLVHPYVLAGFVIKFKICQATTMRQTAGIKNKMRTRVAKGVKSLRIRSPLTHTE